MQTKQVRGITLALDYHEAARIDDDAPDLVVFIHGVGADRTAWKPQHEAFNAAGFSTAAIDMRGTGDSQARNEQGLALPISIEEFALDVDQLITELGYFDAHWVGNSMGGVIVQEAMMRKLSSVRSAVLCNTFAKHPDSAAILPRAAAALRVKSLEVFARERIPLVLSKEIDNTSLEEAINAMARKDPETYLASWRATWSPDYRAHLKSMDYPTLVIAGSQDQITPPALSEELAASIPNAKLHIIEGAGHISNMDKAEEFNQVVIEFLKTA